MYEEILEEENVLSVRMDCDNKELLEIGNIHESVGYFKLIQGENDVYTLRFTKSRPEGNLYTKRRDTEDYYGICIDYEPKTEKYKELTVHEYFDNLLIYSSTVTNENIEDTPYFCDIVITEAPVEAYAEVKVYKGYYEVIDIYIDDTQIDDYIDAIVDGKVDMTSFNKRVEMYSDDDK